MLEHQKLVLKNVSYDKDLFKKELIKSFAWLNAYELTQLRVWLNANFKNTHWEVIKDIMYPSKYVA